MSERSALRTRAAANGHGARVSGAGAGVHGEGAGVHGEGDTSVGVIAGVVIAIIVVLGFASAAPSR